jgi:hypothetical protein
MVAHGMDAGATVLDSAHTIDWHLMCSAVVINDEAWEPNRTLRRQ